jgi:hypothetical protein
MRSSAASTPSIFFSVSSYSLPGSLSATMPAPARTVTSCLGVSASFPSSTASTVAERMTMAKSASSYQET